MIDSLIGKYKKKLEHITNLKNKTSFELVRVSCLEKEFIVKEMIKDLEELKEDIDNKLFNLKSEDYLTTGDRGETEINTVLLAIDILGE